LTNTGNVSVATTYSKLLYRNMLLSKYMDFDLKMKCPSCHSQAAVVADEDELDPIVTYYCPSCVKMWNGPIDVMPAQ